MVYVDQLLGAAHSKCWLKHAFSLFSCKKLKKQEKARKLRQNLVKKLVIEFAPKRWASLYTGEIYEVENFLRGDLGYNNLFIQSSSLYLYGRP